MNTTKRPAGECLTPTDHTGEHICKERKQTLHYAQIPNKPAQRNEEIPTFDFKKAGIGNTIDCKQQQRYQ
jgi:hypothetical protein